MFKQIITAMAVGLFSLQANAYTFGGTYDAGTDTYVGGTDAGGLDTFLGMTDDLANSNPGTEATFLEGLVADLDATFEWKSDEFDAIFADGDDTVIGFEIDSLPLEDGTNGSDFYSYFIVKNADFWIAYENLDNVDWGVFSLTELATEYYAGDWCTPAPDGYICDSNINLLGGQTTISHVTFFTGGGDQGDDPGCTVDCDPPDDVCIGDCTVPEPGMLALLAIGLLGAAGARRFKV